MIQKLIIYQKIYFQRCKSLYFLFSLRKEQSATQISDGLSESLGIDLKSLLAGFLGGKMLGNDSVTINVDDKN